MTDIKIFEIEPIQLVTINGFKINNINVKVGQNRADIAIDLLNNGELVQTKYLIIDGSEYVNWASDYPYLINWICGKLGLTLVS